MFDTPFRHRPRGSRHRARRTRRGASIFALCAGLLLYVGVDQATAQPHGWSAGLRRLEVVNLASGVVQASFDAPDGVSFGSGVLTPDGRFYLLPTTRGILRFRTDSLSLERTIGSDMPITQLAVPPAGTLVYAATSTGLSVVDWASGVLVSSRCCNEVSAIHFTPDGRIRLEVTGGFNDYRLTAFVAATDTRIWSFPLHYNWIEVAASNTQVAVNTDYNDSRAVLIFSVLDGTFQAWLPGVAPNGMAWRGAELLVSEIDYVDPPIPSTYRLRLYAFDQALRRRVIADRIPVHRGLTGVVTVSHDARRAYWLYYDSADHFNPSYLYDVIDLDTNALLGTGRLGQGFVVGFAVEGPEACVLLTPSTVTAPIEGGVVGIPVVPESTCVAWSAPGQPAVLNPGPHSGPTTLLVQTWANTAATPKLTPVVIGWQTALITQPSGVPAGPALEAAVSGDRVTLFWTPDIGAGITSFVIRGAIAGSEVSDVLQVPAHLRAWTSPPLPPGSYEVELVAANEAGRSAASNRRAFSIGVAGTPEPPSGLTASVADDRVALSWTPASAIPAPSGFVIEAAANASTGLRASGAERRAVLRRHARAHGHVAGARSIRDRGKCQ